MNDAGATQAHRKRTRQRLVSQVEHLEVGEDPVKGVKLVTAVNLVAVVDVMLEHARNTAVRVTFMHSTFGQDL